MPHHTLAGKNKNPASLIFEKNWPEKLMINFFGLAGNFSLRDDIDHQGKKSI